MDAWLTDNPIANLRGPEFLLVYLLFITLVCLWAWFWARRNTSANAPAPPVPSRPDPYEVAYLRGGNSALAEVVCFSLLERGYLEMMNDNRLQRVAQSDSNLRRLSEVERLAYDWISKGRSFGEIRSRSGLAAQMAAVSTVYEQKATGEGLLWSAEARRRALGVAFAAALLIGGLGFYKLLLAISRGHRNIGLLILLLPIGSLTAFFVTRLPRLTKRGRQYLERLRTAFSNMRPEAEAAMSDLGLRLTLGLFGVAALQGTAYAGYTHVWQPPGAVRSSDGGSSCSSSSSDSSSCSSSSSDSSSCSSSSCSSGSSCSSSSCGGCGSSS